MGFCPGRGPNQSARATPGGHEYRPNSRPEVAAKHPELVSPIQGSGQVNFRPEPRTLFWADWFGPFGAKAKDTGIHATASVNLFEFTSQIGVDFLYARRTPRIRLRIGRTLRGRLFTRGVRPPRVPIHCGRNLGKELEMMRHIVFNGLLLSGLLVGGFAPRRGPSDPKPGDQKSGTEQPNIESKVEKAVPMPDFAGAYGLPLESLRRASGTGSRMPGIRATQSRWAMIGIELAVAEKVSGEDGGRDLGRDPSRRRRTSRRCGGGTRSWRALAPSSTTR